MRRVGGLGCGTADGPEITHMGCCVNGVVGNQANYADTGRGDVRHGGRYVAQPWFSSTCFSVCDAAPSDVGFLCVVASTMNHTSLITQNLLFC